MTRPQPLEERFWPKVNKDGPVPEHCPELGPCWIWTRATTGFGYGKISVSGGKWRAAHVVSWIMAKGDIPAGLFVLHRCDNPPCVRPSHLRLGTAKDNTQDMYSKGRGGRMGPKGEQHPQAKLTTVEVVALRERFAQGEYLKDLCDEFGIYWTTGSNVVNGRTWPEAGGPIRPPGQLGRRVAKQCVKGHLYTEQNTYINSDGAQMCRQCLKDNASTPRAKELARERMRRYRERKKAK